MGSHPPNSNGFLIKNMPRGLVANPPVPFLLRDHTMAFTPPIVHKFRPRFLLGLSWVCALALTVTVEQALFIGSPGSPAIPMLANLAQVNLTEQHISIAQPLTLLAPLSAPALRPKMSAFKVEVVKLKSSMMAVAGIKIAAVSPAGTVLATTGGELKPDRLLREKAQAVGLLQHEVVQNTLGDLYQVEPNRADQVWISVLKETQGTSVNPLLMMAVIAQESRFDPKAVSSSGARGLTQVIPHWHQDKIRPGDKLTSIPVSVRIGVHILNDYLKSSDGNVTLALQKYNGSSQDRSHRYAKRVFKHERTLVHAILSRADTPVARIDLADISDRY